MNFFRPGGLNPSVAAALLASGGAALRYAGAGYLCSSAWIQCELRSRPPCTGCVPFGDMDANYSNGSSVYHGLTANLRKRFSKHYEFLASYTWSHAIDDSTDLQSTLTPQDSYFPSRIARRRCLTSATASSSTASTRAANWRVGLCQQVLQQLDVCSAHRVRLRTAVQHHHRQRRQSPVVVAYEHGRIRSLTRLAERA